jgi:hypothetical protein
VALRAVAGAAGAALAATLVHHGGWQTRHMNTSASLGCTESTAVVGDCC